MTDPERAARFVLETGPDVPFWPQLPRRAAAEGMIPQYAANMPCVKWDEAEKGVIMDASNKYSELETFYDKYLSDDQSHFALAKDRAAGFHAFRDALESKAPPPVLKGQITGPLTFTTGISDSQDKTLYSDPELRDAAVKFLGRNAAWQVQNLKRLGASEIIIFADEPVLAAYGSSAYVGISEEAVLAMLSEIFSAVSEAGAIPGMHVCGNSDWAMAMRSGVEVLNFDAYQYGTTLGLYSDSLQEFIDRDGLIAWGIVPTTAAIEDETAGSLMERINSLLEVLETKGFERYAIVQHSMLTPSCGAGSLNERQTGKVFSLLKELKSALLDAQ